MSQLNEGTEVTKKTKKNKKSDEPSKPKKKARLSKDDAFKRWLQTVVAELRENRQNKMIQLDTKITFYHVDDLKKVRILVHGRI